MASHNHKDMKRRLKDYEDKVKQLNRDLKERSAKHFKFLIHRNVDLKLVKQYSTELIKGHVGRKIKDKDLNKLKWKLRSLGNAAPPSLKAGSTVLAFSFLFALVAFL